MIVTEDVGAFLGRPEREVEKQRPIPAGVAFDARDQEPVPGLPQGPLQPRVERQGREHLVVVDDQIVEPDAAEGHAAPYATPGAA